MTENYTENRKQYIEQIKASFHDPLNHEESLSKDKYNKYNRQHERYGVKQPGFYEKSEDVDEAGSNFFTYFKIRLFLAVVIFVAFVLCDQTGSKFYHFTCDEIVEQMEENYDYTNAKKYVIMFFNNNEK